MERSTWVGSDHIIAVIGRANDQIFGGQKILNKIHVEFVLESTGTLADTNQAKFLEMTLSPVHFIFRVELL